MCVICAFVALATRGTVIPIMFSFAGIFDDDFIEDRKKGWEEFINK